MAAISELSEDLLVEGIYGVARKERHRTKGGSPYLALELVDATGRIDARVWSDVDVLGSRFGEGDAVRVLGRVERFRDKLQLDVRTLEAAEPDAGALTPPPRRDPDELDGFLEFLAGEIAHPGLRQVVARFVADAELRARFRMLPATPDGHHSYAGGLLEHTVAVAAICRETAQCIRACARTCSPQARCSTTSGERSSSARRRSFAQRTRAGCSGMCCSAFGSSSGSPADLDPAVRAELVHAVATHHDPRAARTAEAAVLVHANQLDAVAATRPVE